MSQWVRVASVNELSPGQCKTVHAAGKAIALSNVEGVFYAIDDVCAHHGGPLGEGTLEGTTITCPWHHWQYDVTTGKGTVNPQMNVDAYRLKVEGDDVLVEI
jgi:nitrite reductase/ring-hydroxylating ferredoxin subunit